MVVKSIDGDFLTIEFFSKISPKLAFSIQQECYKVITYPDIVTYILVYTLVYSPIKHRGQLGAVHLTLVPLVYRFGVLLVNNYCLYFSTLSYKTFQSDNIEVNVIY